MIFYQLAKPFLYSLPPECAHNLAIFVLKNNLLPPARLVPDPMLMQKICGIDFVHPLGLAAGFDKNAQLIAQLQLQGFSFVEAGTVTNLPQKGNDSPRLFRLTKDAAIINRLGFNNAGLEEFTKKLSAYRNSSAKNNDENENENIAEEKISGKNITAKNIVGANIGKNKDSEDAVQDYILGLTALYPYADYITINISSPNTQGLRTLQKREQLENLLSALIKTRKQLMQQYQRYVPLWLKIAPDLDEADLHDVGDIALQQKIDALIVSNTTIKRPRTLLSNLRGEQGGLSGAPLFSLSTEILARLYLITRGEIPLIGVGGISSAEDAYKKIRAGASLLQLYTALVYQGFGVVREIVDKLPVLLKRDGFTNIKEAVGADHR